MKKLFSFFSMLVLVVLSVGCSDNDDKFNEIIYPTEEQIPFDTGSVKGKLKYNAEIAKWIIIPLEDFNWYSIGDEESVRMLVSNIAEEYKDYEGIITFNGIAKYLYYKSHGKDIPGGILYFSLDLKEIKKEELVKQSRNANNIDECGTQAVEPSSWIFQPYSRVTSNGFYTLNIYVHVIRNSIGQGFNKETVSQTITNNLNSYFYNTNIDFHLSGSDYIDSDTYYNVDDSSFENILLLDAYENAIDIYIVSDGVNLNRFNGIAYMNKSVCAINSDAYSQATIAHEVGHCLGLYHTHHGTFYENGDSHQCSEYVNGTNSDVCGDYITDTPADPNKWLSGVYIGTKTDANGDTYSPDPLNFMSYSGGNRSKFSNGQIELMRRTIENDERIKKVIHNRVLEGDSHFCNSETLNISQLHSGETANWTVTKYYPSSTADDQPLSSQTTTYSGSSITLNASNQSAYYVIQATINGTTTLTKTVTSYVPSPYVGTLAWETTDGQFGVTTNMEHGNTLYVSGTKTLSLEYLDQGGNTEANFTCITAANRYLSGSTITLQTSDCTRDLKIRTSNSCGTSGNFFTIPCEVTSYSYNLNLNNSTLSIDVEETAKASLASALSIRESDIKTSGDIQSIKVRNADGQVIFTKNYSVATKGVRINTSSWLPGEYILEITNGDMTQKRKIRVK